MSLEERRERWQNMVGKLRKSSVQNWFSDFLDTLTDVQSTPLQLATRPAALPIVVDLAGRSRTAQRH